MVAVGLAAAGAMSHLKLTASIGSLASMFFLYFDHHLGVHIAAPYYFLLIIFFFSIQIFIGILGYVVMKSNGYFNDYVRGKKRSFGSYALICPGVAFFVFGMFFIQAGLIKMGILTVYSPTHILLIALLFLIQIKTIITIVRLDKKLLK